MRQQKLQLIRLSTMDNVAIVLTDLTPGTSMGKGDMVCQEHVPIGHKIALCMINPHDPIRKCSQVIGFASKPILPGEHVHTHNMELGNSIRDYAFCSDFQPMQYFAEEEQASFGGIIRKDGRIGTRNYIGVLATVHCSASVSHLIAKSFTKELLTKFPNVDGVVSLAPESGCSIVPDGEGFHLLQKTIAGYSAHPNFAGILLVGLGCELNQVNSLVDNMNLKKGPLFRTIGIQEAGGTRETVDRGVEIIREILHEANPISRCPVPASHIVLGLECGGSDVYTGISANPALGIAVDLLVRHGGTAILSQTPKIYGAEYLLTSRAATPEVRQKVIEKIRWWEQYTRRYGSDMDNNLTPDNIADGLTTIAEKSLVAVNKSGTTSLTEIYGYAEPISAKGLVFMDTPGYDVVSITGMVAGGANVICFTTGRGAVCGSKPVPAIKLASNTKVYRQMIDDMDVNCGTIVDGDATMQEIGEAIFHFILEVASGRKTKSESLGYEASVFVPWQIGPVL